jgi:hypothetical protein
MRAAMDINRTGPRSAHLDNPAQASERTAARFKSSAPAAVDPGTNTVAGSLPAVTQADLANAGKTEEAVTRSFGSLVDDAGRQMGVSPSDAQKRDLVEFLGNDPLMRGKLLSYLEQIAK